MRAWPRGLLACGLLAAFSACGEAPLIKLTLHYSGFEPACVQVQASDGADPDLPAPQPVPVPPGTRNGDLTVSIWGKPGWSDQVRLATEAHEKTCDGPKVAGEVRMVTVTRGQTFSLELFLEATDADQDGFVAAPAGTDCDDAQASIHPGATEICNNQDDNCANGADEGFNVGGPCGGDGGCGTIQCAQDGGTRCANGLAFYRDDDGDGFGRTDDVLYRCTAPAGYALNPGDCQDDAGFVHPGAPEICDGLDDNCVSGVDENLGKGAGCSAPYGCPGQNVCAPDGGVMCQANGSGVTGKHPDEDEDGHGAPTEICVADAGIPVASSSDDCDDGDPFTATGFPEICDRRDNDCDGRVDKDDAGVSACPNDAGWVAHTAGGSSHVWRSVWSWTDGGVWATGAVQKLRVHAPDDTYAAGTMWPKNYDSDCANGTYTGVWADPANGMAFTVGPAGLFCTHALAATPFQDQGGIVSANLPDPVSVVGFRTGSAAEVYVVGLDGGTLRWFADAGSQPLDPISGVHLNDIHGSSRDVIFAAGQAPGAPADPRLYRFSQPSTWIQTPLPAPLPNSGASVQAVYSVSPRLAFAVTDTAAVVEWNGSAWAMHPAPPDAGALRGVLAFGRDSLFVIDSKTAWEWNGSAWTRLLDAGTGGTLVDLHGTNPADIWVAQDPQMVYRWPQ